MKLHQSKEWYKQSAATDGGATREAGFAGARGSARAWQCNLGNGQWDHDWQEKHDDAGEVDGIPGDHWSWRECRVCGEIEAPNPLIQKRHV